MSEVVVTRSGRVRGLARDGILTWRGIPFATARRFAPPEPVAAWTDERDATRFAPVAMQSRDPRIAMMSGVTDKIATSEDCLSLNIYAPADRGRRHPVVVWIHGGAFVMGAGSQPLYNGTGFARDHDLVVVTINYRLGVFGLLYLGDLLPGYAAGNVALLDQLAALSWVKDNIEAFGGDPDRVTLMGESAGAISIAHLLAMPAARGLFDRAILQSGAIGLSPPSRADATAFAEAVCRELDVEASALPEVPADRLVEVQDRLRATRGLGAFAPYVDGVTIPKHPLELVREGAGPRVPLLLGSTRDEWALFDTLLGASATTNIVRAQLRGALGPMLDRFFETYRTHHPDDARAWVDLVGDVAFRIPMIKLAEAHAAHAPMWMYRFDWATPAFGGKLGAAHGLDLPFVWNTVDAPVAKFLLGDGGPGARRLATSVHGAWARFVAAGEPAHEDLPAWPRYEAPRRATMLLDDPSRVADDPAGETRALWG